MSIILAASSLIWAIQQLGKQRVHTSLLAIVAIALGMTCIAGCIAEDTNGAQSGDRDTASPAMVTGNATDDPIATAPDSKEKLEDPPVSKKILVRHPNEISNPSIVQILAHRDRYHGEVVMVKGYLRVQFEGTAIYLSKEDADYGISGNGFSVSLNKTFKQYDRKYVLIEGTFDKDNRGHFSAYQGTIKNITRVVELTKHE